MYTVKNELYHYGVTGMKWGVRRYQNADGTLTTAGKKRYSKDAYEAKKIKKKKTSQMSNEELRILNNRQELERKHKQLNPGTIHKGIKYVGTASAILATGLSLYNNSNAAIKVGKRMSENVCNVIGDLIVKRH